MKILKSLKNSSQNFQILPRFNEDRLIEDIM